MRPFGDDGAFRAFRYLCPPPRTPYPAPGRSMTREARRRRRMSGPVRPFLPPFGDHVYSEQLSDLVPPIHRLRALAFPAGLLLLLLLASNGLTAQVDTTR